MQANVPRAAAQVHWCYLGKSFWVLRRFLTSEIYKIFFVVFSGWKKSADDNKRLALAGMNMHDKNFKTVNTSSVKATVVAECCTLCKGNKIIIIINEWNDNPHCPHCELAGQRQFLFADWRCPWCWHYIALLYSPAKMHLIMSLLSGVGWCEAKVGSRWVWGRHFHQSAFRDDMAAWHRTLRKVSYAALISNNSRSGFVNNFFRFSPLLP